MSRQLLFLDIDGVMHSVDHVQANPTRIGLDDSNARLYEHLPRLADILAQCPDVAVVVSSDWRHRYSLAELQGFFGACGDRVIGTTAGVNVLHSQPQPINRFQECQAVAEQFGVTDWVMVDDQPGIVWGSQIPGRDFVRRVIWRDPILGLGTPLVVDSIMKRFRGTAPTGSIDDRKYSS